MSSSIHTSYAVIVLGDKETLDRADLAEKAAEHGAVIAERHGFEPGEAAMNENLSEVDAVVTAISRAIATRADVWVPFPFPDLGREQHVRRLSLVLQRHGQNMLMGHHLEPCTLDGGFNSIDFALREEVRSVDELDYAAMANAGVGNLFTDIARELKFPRHVEPEPAECGQPGESEEFDEHEEPTAVGEKYYSTAEVARFFGKSNQWVYWAMRTGVFTDKDGSRIEPMRIGKNGRRRFTIPVLRSMARACYRRGIVTEDELLNLLGALAREGGDE